MMADISNFLNKLRKIHSLMVRVSTGKVRDRTKKENEYQELYNSLDEYFNSFGIHNPNGFSSLEEFYGYWDSSLPTYKERREFITSMYGEIEKTLASALKKGEPLKIDSKLKRVAEHGREHLSDKKKTEEKK